MRKRGKGLLALFLAGIMALTPLGESVAAERGTVIVTETVTETGTEESTAEPETKTEESAEEPERGTEEGTEESETGIEDSTEETETGTEESTTEPGTEPEESTAEPGTGTEENTTEAETEEETETETETASTEEETEISTENETEIETETETEPEETMFPGLQNTILNSEQKADRKELAVHISEIESLKEGIDYAAGELVFLADTKEEAEAIAASYGGILASYEEGVGVVELSARTSVVEAVRAAALSDKVVLPPAWPNYIYKICTEEVVAETEIDESEGYEALETPAEDIPDEVYTDEGVYSEAVQGYNDPLLKQTNANYQWQHAMVGSANAWNAGYTGSGIKIAILDTGVTAQTDLNVVGSFNMTSSGSAGDGQGHGTHVAGLAAAKANNGTMGAGIAPGASIINIKVLGDDGSGKASWIMAGINKAVSQGADIINMSLGGNLYSKAYETVVENAYKRGVAVFAAAANDGSKAKAYPAAYKGAIAIGAVQQNKARTYFSNYGSWVKFSAPGWKLSSLPKSGSSPVVMSGTSQATPVVSGTAAVILSADANIRAKKGKARVDALVSKMNKGKIAGNGGAAGIVSLPKALGIPLSTATPKAPTFAAKSGTKFPAERASIVIKAYSKADRIYYSVNGKAPAYKNGVLTNAIEYKGAISIGGQKKVTVQAIAVNSCGKVSKTAKASYTFEPLVSGIAISGDNVVIQGKSTTLKATVIPDYAKTKAVTWSSSDSKAVKVSSSGKVSATKDAQIGKTYTITAAAKDKSGKKATFNITVKKEAEIKAVSFSKKSDTVTRGSKDVSYNAGALLKVDKADKTAGKVTDVKWSVSNTKTASVNANGVVTALRPGKVTVKAAAKDGSGKSTSFTLTIKQQVTKITVQGLDKLSAGKSTKLTAALNDGSKEKAPSSKEVTWTISPSGTETGVTVDKKSGTVKASKKVKAGNYTITAAAADGSGVVGKKVIAVSDNAITKITLNSKSATIFRTAGNSHAKTSCTISAAITAKTADGKNASSNAVEFTSSNKGVATVKQNGTTATITAAGGVTGTTTITCRALDGSGKTASCKVTVVNPASKLTVTPPGGNAGYVGAGKKIKMSAVFEEEFGKTAGKKVTWTSSNTSVATVDQKGNVKGVKAGGSAVITAAATDGSGLKASYTVGVTAAIKKLAVGGTYMSYNPRWYYLGLDLGEKGGFYVYYNGKQANNTDNSVFGYVAVEVANPDIVSASWDSRYSNVVWLYGNKKGTTKITLKALDGSGTKVTYTVKVK